MVKKLLLFSFALLFFFLRATPSMAQGIAGQSALFMLPVKKEITFKKTEKNINFNLKKKTIKRVLERYNSPLVDSADDFINTCKQYDLDCYLLPSISGVESYFGMQLMPGSHNPFGWGRGLIYFDSWSAGIDTVGRGLRENYINKGATTIEQIGAIYCEGNTWSGKVRSIMKTFEDEEKKHELYFSGNTVEL